MPGGDRTGPMGQGPMTGRRAGFCAGYDVPGYANPIPGRGWGAGWGRGGWGAGRGYRWRNWYYATGVPGWARWGYPPAWPPAPYAYASPPDSAQEAEWLRSQAEWLKEQLETISKRITELEEKEE